MGPVEGCTKFGKIFSHISTAIEGLVHAIELRASRILRGGNRANFSASAKESKHQHLAIH